MTREDLIDEIWSVMQNVQDYDTGLHDFAKAVVRDVPLIAAAPDLLAALKEAHRALSHYEWYAKDDWKVRFNNEAAIAKAQP
jgi:hypothetical protein